MVQTHVHHDRSQLPFRGWGRQIFEKMESNSTINSDIYGKVQA